MKIFKIGFIKQRHFASLSQMLKELVEWFFNK